MLCQPETIWILCRLLYVLWSIVGRPNIQFQLLWRMPSRHIAICSRNCLELTSSSLEIQQVEELLLQCFANFVRRLCQCHAVAFWFLPGRTWDLMACGTRHWKTSSTTSCVSDEESLRESPSLGIVWDCPSTLSICITNSEKGCCMICKSLQLQQTNWRLEEIHYCLMQWYLIS